MLPEDGWKRIDFRWKYLSKEFLNTFLEEFPANQAPLGNFGPNEIPAISIYRQLLQNEPSVREYITAGYAKGEMSSDESKLFEEIRVIHDISKKCENETYKFLDSILPS